MTTKICALVVHFLTFLKSVRVKGESLNNELKVCFKLQSVYYHLASISQTLLMHQHTPFKQKYSL